MSQSVEQSDLFETFCEEKGYVETFLCPYCEKTFDAPSEGHGTFCCGEPHIDKYWVSDRDSLDTDDIKKAFRSWLDDRTAKAESSRYSEKDEPEYWEDR